jgi:hypothetical protein
MPNGSFISTLRKYAEVTEISDGNLDNLQLKLKEFTTVIIGYHKSNVAFKNYEFTSEELSRLVLSKNNNAF